ncbi:hypothetical protein [Marininema halotolerans]|uniref:Putative thiazole-containing bacteriocin maturation protein n=1 Tax=Marininema halotolerans TaxID=1155944 RepID=A0A1I6QL37_9BACL|nr:hypothetical protein [Marininema halotolerans]SFS53082.1 putative thiazole-containing bacteriocin maturation protein [Marininema halotolerans]
MASLQSSTRLKMNKDTFVLPDAQGGVYIRNNRCSFRLDGGMIAQWIEKLIPVFNGKEPLGEITAGLPKAHQERVYQIANMLYNQGMARDVSQETPHQLSEKVMNAFASQLAFLDAAVGDSGASRFESYRQTKVLLMGESSLMTAVIDALWQSGLPHVHTCVTHEDPLDEERMAELKSQALLMDPSITHTELSLDRKDQSSWEELIKSFDVVLYVARENGLDQLRHLQSICKKEHIALLPGICSNNLVWVGPWMDGVAIGCWESAWRRIHRQEWEEGISCTDTSTIRGVLGHVMAFTCFKEITQSNELKPHNAIFLHRGESMESNWYPTFLHPEVVGSEPVKKVTKAWWIAERSEEDRNEEAMFLAFADWSLPVTGIFRSWEEGALRQLPLAQCKIQVMNPLSEGPADPLPESISVGITHREARKEAGLYGIEAYVSQWMKARNHEKQVTGLGAGRTLSEGVCRGLQKCLVNRWKSSLEKQLPTISLLRLGAMEDRECRFYLEAWSSRGELPRFGLGEEVCGFPVIWVGDHDTWYGSVGLHKSFALKRALRFALGAQQHPDANFTEEGVRVSKVNLREGSPQQLEVSMGMREVDYLPAAREILQQNQQHLKVVDWTVEPFIKQGLAGVFGVSLVEEGD